MTQEEYSIEKLHELQKQMSDLERFMKAHSTALCRVLFLDDFIELRCKLQNMLDKYSNK